MNDPDDPEDAGVSLPGGVPFEAEAPAPSPPVDPRDAGEPPKPIPIVLTFDDGPHAAADVIKRVSDLGHVIAIHTGSDDDHASHTKRVAASAYDVDGDKKPDGMNGLESDLIRAKAQIQKVLRGNAPSFVRAVGLARNEAVNSTYSRVGLKHIGVNVDSKDNDFPGRPRR